MPDYLTKADWLKLKEEIWNKIDNLSKEEQRIRHEAANKQQSIHLNTFEKIDELNSKIEKNDKSNALLNQSQWTMSENVKEIKESLKNVESKMENFFKELPNHFSTKEEHRENSWKITWIIKIIWFFWSIIVVWMGTFIWSLLTELIKNGQS